MPRKPRRPFRRVLFSIPLEHYEALQQRAAELDLSAAQLVRRLVRNYLFQQTNERSRVTDAQSATTRRD